MATCCAPPARPSGWPSCLRPKPEIRAPAQPAKLPEPARGELAFEQRHLPLSDAARNLRAQRFHPRRCSRASGWPWSARRAPARPPSSSSPSASTIRRRARVLLDGVDLTDADPADVRQRIAMVPQETMMFAASRARQPALRQLGRERRRAVAGGARRQCRGFPARAARRARHLHGRRRRAAVRRPAPAHRHRPRAAARCAVPAARRSDLRARCRERAAGAGRARPADGATARRSSSRIAWRPCAPPTGSW